MQLESTAMEREKKLKSLLTDQIEAESALLRSVLSGQDLTVDQSKRIETNLRFNIVQNYGSRDVDKYYCVHPIRVARFLAQSIQGSAVFTEAVIAALLHNCIEKKILSPEQLTEREGPWVGETIAAITPNRQSLKTQDGMDRYYQAIYSKPRELRLLKAFDKFDNFFSLCLNPDELVRDAYLAEAKQFVRPLFEKDLPNLVPYVDALIEDCKRLGFFKPNY